MKCEDYIILINMSVDGEISPEDELKLQEHLSCCEECRREYNEIKVLADGIRKMDIQPPKELHSIIMSKIDFVKQEKIPFYKTKVFGVAVAACLLIAAAGAFLPAAGQMFVPKVANDSAMYANGDKNGNMPSAMAPTGGIGSDDMGMIDEEFLADMTKAEIWDTPVRSPESSDNIPNSASSDLPGSMGTVNSSNFILKGSIPLPKEIEKYSPEYHDGEVYIRLSSEHEAKTVYKLLYAEGFEAAEQTDLSQNGLSIFADAENTILIVSK